MSDCSSVDVRQEVGENTKRMLVDKGTQQRCKFGEPYAAMPLAEPAVRIHKLYCDDDKGRKAVTCNGSGCEKCFNKTVKAEIKEKTLEHLMSTLMTLSDELDCKEVELAQEKLKASQLEKKLHEKDVRLRQEEAITDQLKSALANSEFSEQQQYSQIKKAKNRNGYIANLKIKLKSARERLKEKESDISRLQLYAKQLEAQKD